MTVRVPKLCSKAARGHAYCFVTDPATGRQEPMGRADDPGTATRYEAWRREFVARALNGTARVAAGPTLTVTELVDAHDGWAVNYYRKHGRPTSEANNFQQTHRFLRPFYAVPVAEFGPLRLKAVRQAMVEAKLERNHVNEQVNRVRRIFRWGVENQLVGPEVLAALAAVAPLAKGRTPARERVPVRPVPFEVFEATLPRLRPAYRALAVFHLHAGCRPCEAVIARPCDIDRSREPWLYVPSTWKTEHHEGNVRVVALGPKARAALEPRLALTTPKGWLFPSRGRGRHHGRGPGHLTVSGYRNAVEAACAAHDARPACRGRAARPARPAIPEWHPRQLRHSWLTHVRRLMGKEAARQVGGHADPRTTDLYALEELALALQAAERLG